MLVTGGWVTCKMSDFLLGSNILLSTLFSNTPCLFLNVRDKVSHPHKTKVELLFCIFSSSRF
jgi:hypothetical protein